MKKISGKWIFVVIVLAIYLILLIFNPILAEKSFLTSLKVFTEIAPLFLIVILFMFLNNYLLSSDKIVKLLGKGSGIKGWALSLVGGVLSTGPIFVWYPLLKELKDKGMESSLIGVFLFNRAVKIPFLPMMIFYFGISFTIILSIYMLIFSIINGFLLGKIER
jgi:hypothetical protein